MKAKDKAVSSSDMKKWGLFLLFPIAIFAVIYFATPGGESKARELIVQARAKHREANLTAAQTNTPQDRANADLSREALDRAESYLIESDYANVIFEAQKAINSANKVIRQRAPVVVLSGAVRFQEMTGAVTVKRRGGLDYEPASKKDGLDVGDAVRTAESAACRMTYVNNVETTLHPLSDLLFPDALNRDAGGDGVFDFFLEEGGLTVKTSELQGRRRATVMTDAARLEIYPNTEARIDYTRLTKVMAVWVAAGRVDVQVGAQLATVSKQERLAISPNQNLGQPQPTLSQPRLKGPENFAKFTANQNGFASVSLAWDGDASDGYAIELSAEPLFAKPLRVRENYPAGDISFADLTEGVYYWRVTCGDLDDPRSLPSAWRLFEISGGDTAAPEASADRGRMPRLNVTHVQVQGYIVIISGRSEPNAKVMVEGESAIVDEKNGQFSYAASMPGKGVYTLNVVAMNAIGNRVSVSVPIEIKD